MDVNDWVDLEVWCQISSIQVRAQVWHQVWRQVYDPVMVQIRDQGLDQVQIQLWDDLDGY
jgi:hypothetical protein